MHCFLLLKVQVSFMWPPLYTKHAMVRQEKADKGDRTFPVRGTRVIWRAEAGPTCD